MEFVGAGDDAVADVGGATGLVLGWPASGEPWQAVSVRALRAAKVVPRAGRRGMGAPFFDAVGVSVAYGGCSGIGYPQGLQVPAGGMGWVVDKRGRGGLSAS